MRWYRQFWSGALVLRLVVWGWALFGVTTAAIWAVNLAGSLSYEPLEYPSRIVTVNIGYNDWSVRQAILTAAMDNPHRAVLDVYDTGDTQSSFLHVWGAGEQHVFAIPALEVRHQEGEPPIKLGRQGVPLAMN